MHFGSRRASTRTALAVLLALAVTGSAQPSQATTLDFETIIGGGGAFIPAGYGGLVWGSGGATMLVVQNSLAGPGIVVGGIGSFAGTPNGGSTISVTRQGGGTFTFNRVKCVIALWSLPKLWYCSTRSIRTPVVAHSASGSSLN